MKKLFAILTAICSLGLGVLLGGCGQEAPKIPAGYALYQNVEAQFQMAFPKNWAIIDAQATVVQSQGEFLSLAEFMAKYALIKENLDYSLQRNALLLYLVDQNKVLCSMNIAVRDETKASQKQFSDSQLLKQINQGYEDQFKSVLAGFKTIETVHAEQFGANQFLVFKYQGGFEDRILEYITAMTIIDQRLFTITFSYLPADTKAPDTFAQMMATLSNAKVKANYNAAGATATAP